MFGVFFFLSFCHQPHYILSFGNPLHFVALIFIFMNVTLKSISAVWTFLWAPASHSHLHAGQLHWMFCWHLNPKYIHQTPLPPLFSPGVMLPLAFLFLYRALMSFQVSDSKHGVQLWVLLSVSFVFASSDIMWLHQRRQTYQRSLCLTFPFPTLSPSGSPQSLSLSFF